LSTQAEPVTGDTTKPDDAVPAEKTSQDFFEVRDLWVYYGGVAALKGISFNVEEGSVITLIGGNGAGKSTTLRSVSGLLKSQRGEIWLKGERIDGMPAHRVMGKGVVAIPEGRRLFSSMTVYENLKLGAYARKDREAIEQDMASIYEHFPVLKRRADQRAGTLSGGEQQMVAVGRALMARPKLLLMDEPSMGLSPILVNEVSEIVRDINRRLGVSILLVEQNARMALNLATRGYVLQTGTIVREGPSQDLMNDEELRIAYLGG